MSSLQHYAGRLSPLTISLFVEICYHVFDNCKITVQHSGKGGFSLNAFCSERLKEIAEKAGLFVKLYLFLKSFNFIRIFQISCYKSSYCLFDRKKSAVSLRLILLSSSPFFHEFVAFLA